MRDKVLSASSAAEECSSMLIRSRTLPSVVVEAFGKNVATESILHALETKTESFVHRYQALSVAVVHDDQSAW